MSSFFPAGLDLKDLNSPSRILKEADAEWRRATDGTLGLAFEKADSESGEATTLVIAEHLASRRTATIFSIVHRPDSPYPVSIEFGGDRIPNRLRKRYTISRPGLGTIRVPSNLMAPTVEEVTNPWVADTPSEFREKLMKALNTGEVKGVVLNLLSSDVEFAAE